jgi:predicted AAA+ superfamily ATPase
MDTYKRSLTTNLTIRLAEPKPLIQVLIGPRQVGKTTALRAAMGGHGLYESADSPTPPSHEMLNQWWDQAIASGHRILAIDEVQKISGWSEVIKRRWDESPHALKVVLTGSSALLLEKGLSETLAGRFELIRATHWSYAEARDAFGLDLRKYIEFGCYPGSMHLLHDVTRWSSYIRDSIVESVIGRDLLMLHPVNNPALLRQVFGLAAGMPASLISLQKMMGQLQHKGSVPTIQNYLTLLGQAFLVTGVNKFSANVIREKKSSPKLIIHDNGLARAFARPVEALLTPEVFGYYFENVVGARLIEAGWDVFYWKHGKSEVDFVVHGPGGERLAIEVKSGATTESELAGLKVFCGENKDYEPILISLVDQKIAGIGSKSAEWVLSLGG